MSTVTPHESRGRGGRSARRQARVASGINQIDWHIPVNTDRPTEPLDQERIEAIGRANSQLITSDRGARTLSNLIAQEMEQLGPELQERLAVTGEDPRLAPGLASVIVLALHELINNAVKHGAYSVADGRVAVEVAREDGGYRLAWRERSGSLALPEVPEREGFGVLLLRELIAGEVGGEARLGFRPDGIDYVLRFPVAEGAP